MLKVSLILLASFLCPLIVSSHFFDGYIYGVSYVLYLTSIALIYMAFSLVGLIFAESELKKGNNFNSLLICALSFCMCVTAMFNLSMINIESFKFINEAKSGEGLSWRSIYSSIEILILLIVGGNGLNYLAHVDICSHGKRNATIRDNINPNQGEQQ